MNKFAFAFVCGVLLRFFWDIRWQIACVFGIHDWWVFTGDNSYPGHEEECNRCKRIR